MGMTESDELGGRWGRLLVGVAAIGLFAFGIVPGLQQLGPVREIRTAIRNRGIDATALFYTESELSSEAEASIRGALRYPAGRALLSGEGTACSGSPAERSRRAFQVTHRKMPWASRLGDDASF